MKNINYYILSFLVGILAFSSCQSEVMPEEKTTGYLDFQIVVDQNPEVVITRSGFDVDDFGVKITGPNNYFRIFNSYKNLKDEGLIELDANPDTPYTVVAYSSDQVILQSSATPTYFGQTTQYIAAGIPSRVEVECSMRELKIELDLTSASLEIIENLEAFIYLDGDQIYEFKDDIDENGLHCRYFEPNENLELRLTGTYNGLELQIVRLIKGISEIGDIKGNKIFRINVEIDSSPEAAVMNQSLLFNLQTISAK